MNYKTYAEAKIANPDCEIVTTGKDWSGDLGLAGIFEALVLDEYSDNHEDGAHEIDDESWVVCNPADYCSTLKEFLDAGFKLAEGDVVMTVNCSISKVKDTSVHSWNRRGVNDNGFFILSASALDGGSKIPNAEVNKLNYTIEDLRGKYVKVGTQECEVFLTACANIGVVWSDMSSANKAPENAEFIGISLLFSNGKTLGHSREKYWVERGFLPFNPKDNGCILDANLELAESWTIYNNTLQLSELSNEQAAQLFNAWRDGGNVEFDSDCGEWLCADDYLWIGGHVYRIKQKSKRELFIETSAKLMTSEAERTMEQMFGAQFDAGARYVDLTQYFGENI